MLTRWTLENFKSIYEKTAIELAPLTIFAGANSSGKSTIIQSILLTAQTLQNPVPSRSVVLNGHVLRMGTFDDVVSNTRENQSVHIGFSLEPPASPDSLSRAAHMHTGAYNYLPPEFMSNLKAIELSFDFNTKAGAEERELLQLQPQLGQSRLLVHLHEQEDAEDKEIHIVRSSVPADERAAALRITDPHAPTTDLDSLRYEVIKPENMRSGRRYRGYGVPIKGKSAGATFNHFLPSRISIVFDAVDQETRSILELLFNPREGRLAAREMPGAWQGATSIALRETLLKLTQDIVESTQQELFGTRAAAFLEQLQTDFSLTKYLQNVTNLPPASRRVLAEKLSEKATALGEAIKAGRKPRFVLSYTHLPPTLDFAVDYIRTYFTANLKYLGPLRDEPKPVYPLSGTTDPRDVGFKGEHTAAVLDVHKNTQIEYLPSEAFISPTAEPRRARGTLLAAVSDWLGYMGVVQNLKTVDKGKLGHELRVATTGPAAFHDLTHVGVGVSQVLPILVLSLLADSGSTLIFEQPELHLHPRVQTRLAEFFVAMSMLGKQCIVETHSEYLINRLRYLSAVTEGKAISDRVILYFVEKDAGHSTYRPIRINEYGVIQDWPKGFFDENEENAAATLKAAMDKRRRPRGARNAPHIS